MRSACLMILAATMAAPAVTMRARIDHVVVGIRNLDEGIAAFERLSGVTATRGGQHPTRGTENALVSLGPGRYLELIAPRTDAGTSPDLEEMRKLLSPAVIGWAVNVSDMQAARAAMAAVGVTLEPDTPGARVTPADTRLEWVTADISSPPIASAPFLIHWKSTPHPSSTAPTGCSMLHLEVRDPAAADLSRALNALRVAAVNVRRGDAQITVTLKCPRGSVTLRTAAS